MPPLVGEGGGVDWWSACMHVAAAAARQAGRKRAAASPGRPILTGCLAGWHAGGCTAAGACGLAVLDVIREERLQDNAATVGAYCLRRLREVQVCPRAVGCGGVC